MYELLPDLPGKTKSFYPPWCSSCQIKIYFVSSLGDEGALLLVLFASLATDLPSLDRVRSVTTSA